MILYMPEAPTVPVLTGETTARPILIDPRGVPLAATSSHEAQTPAPATEEQTDTRPHADTTEEPGNLVPPGQTEMAAPAPERVSEERQQREVQALSSNILYRRSREITSLNNAFEHAVRGIQGLNELPNGIYRNGQGISATAEGTNDILVNVDGRQRKVVLIKSGNDETLECVVEDPDGHEGTTVQHIPRAEIFRGQVLAVEQTLLDSGQFSQNELVVLRAYFASLGSRGERPQGQALDQAIQEVAKDAGVLTRSDLESFIRTHFKPAEGQSLSPHQETMQQSMLEALENTNIADADTVVRILDIAGINSKNLAEQAQSASQTARQAQQALASDPENIALQQNLKQAQALEKMLKMAVDTLDQGGIKNYFEQMAKGQIDKTRSRELASAFRSGDVNTIISMIMKENENDTPEQKEEKQRMRLELGKYAEGAGVGAGILFVLLMMMAFSGLSQGFRQH